MNIREDQIVLLFCPKRDENVLVMCEATGEKACLCFYECERAFGGCRNERVRAGEVSL